MTDSPSVSMIVCSPSMICATALMNFNSVTGEVEPDFHAAARRLAIFLHHTKTLQLELDVARQDFFVHLSRNWKSYTAGVRQKPELDYIAYADGLGYLARLHAILYEMKAFLDLLARVMCRLISSKPGPNGFNKGKVEDIELSGGRLVNWLAGHTIESLSTRDSLVRVITESSREWITEAVALRDTLGHYRDIAGFRHMRVSISKGPEDLRPTDILAPEIQHGTPIDVFTYQLRDKVCSFASAILQLLPGVKSELNEPWPNAARYLNEK